MDEVKKPVQKAKDEIMMMFKENRSFELHLLGFPVIRFEGRQWCKMPRSILLHPDFTDYIKDKFVIQEVQ